MRDLIEKHSKDENKNKENYQKVRLFVRKYQDNRMALTRIFNDLFLSSDTRKFNKALGEHTKDGVGMIIDKLPLSTIRVYIYKLAACYYNIPDHDSLEDIASVMGAMYKYKYKESNFNY